MKGKILLNYNFKGGVGKSTLTGLQLALLVAHHHHVLGVDLDPQANLTEMMSATYHTDKKPARSFYDGFTNGNLNDTLVHVNDYLDMIPGDWRLNKLVDNLAKIDSKDRFNLLRRLLEPFKDKYDYILLDVPPTLNDVVLNAIFAADGISIVLQTQKLAYTSAIKTIGELAMLKKKFHPPFILLGVVLYLYSKAKMDRDIIHAAKSTFKKAVYPHPIKFQERVKGFTAKGIKDHDHWDQRAIGNYNLVNHEIIKRAERMIK